MQSMGVSGKWRLTGSAGEYVIAFAAGAALLLASLANFLTYNDYPYFRADVALVVFALLTLSAVMVPIYLGQRQWGRSVLEGLLAAVFVDLNTDSQLLIAAVFVGVAAVTLWRRFSLLGPMAVLGSVIFLTTVAGVGGRPSWIKMVTGHAPGISLPDKPAIIHIILDEHLGPEGLSNEGPEGRRLSNELRDLYVNLGFAVYGGAYSQHYHSANSIPFILNYGGALGKRVEKEGVEVGPTKHLQSLVASGYRLSIIQSNYADFCTGTKFHECITYESSSLRPTLAVPMGDLDRAKLTIYKFLKLSSLFDRPSQIWNITAYLARRAAIELPFYNYRSGNSSTVGTLQSMSEISKRLESIKPGEAIFAHLLLPHHPYVVDRNCSYLPWSPWEGLKTAAPMKVKLQLYYEQVRCTSLQMRMLVDAVDRSPAGSNSVIIIHGDHGSRMSGIGAENQSSRNFDDSDMIPVFSTIFAVRGPGVIPGYSERHQAVAALLHDFAASGFRSAPNPNPPPIPLVFLTDSSWKPVRSVPLPTNWAQAH
jgi:hypothetical protein